MSVRRRLTTDTGTVVVHALLVVSFVVLLLTGLRIASDDPAARWVGFLDAVLPVEHLWFRHCVAAVVFTAVLSAYAVYIISARLGARTRIDGARVAGLMRGGVGRWKSCAAFVHWALMATFVVQLVTGIMLFLDAGGAAPAVHLFATWCAVALVGLHVGLHWMVGGMAQWLRIVRPERLKMPPPDPDFAELLAEHLSRQDAKARPEREAAAEFHLVRRELGNTMTLHAHPMVGALIVAAGLGTFAVGFESATRPGLTVKRIAASQAPKIDGDLSDPAWAGAGMVTVVTTQGGDFGGSGQSTVEVRAVHDDAFAYFAFVWTDPTRSLKHMPLVKTGRGWSLVATDRGGANENHFHEDKFAVLLSRATFPLVGAAIHLAAAPLRDRPASATGRGLHYTSDGSIADMWVWRASHEGARGHIDNCHIGGPAEATDAQHAGRERYAGGFGCDPLSAAYYPNVDVRRVAGAALGTSQAITVPRRLPNDLGEALRSLGRLTNSTRQSEGEGARWWLAEAHSVPYTQTLDQGIPEGTVIPGIVMRDAERGDPSGLKGRARWASGRWTLEVVRRRRTESHYDVSLESGTLVWLAAFDHAQTRHTRHLRPITLEFEP